MHHFDYRNGELYCEDVAVAAIAEAVGTPFYLYSHATLTRHYLALDRAFDGLERLICYSAKANTNMAVLALFARLGSGLDIVSGGELYRGLKAGFAPSRIVYSGVGKTAEEIDYALETGIFMLNVESPEELALIDQRQFFGGFDIEHEDARLEGIVNLFRGFAHPGVNDPRRGETGFEPPVELAARNDVQPAAEAGEKRQNGHIGVGLGGVADQALKTVERPVQG